MVMISADTVRDAYVTEPCMVWYLDGGLWTGVAKCADPQDAKDIAVFFRQRDGENSHYAWTDANGEMTEA